MPGSTQNYTSASTLRGVGVAMIVTASIFFLSRTGARFHQRGWRLQAEDCLVALAYIFFLSMSIAYLVVIDPVYRLSALQNGEIEPSPNLLEDADLVTKVFFCTTILLWLCLWSVKLAFLCLYRRLMKGLPLYIRWWSGILIFTILTFIGALISNFLSCANFTEWFTPGACTSRRDQIAQIASLYYAFAVDVLTDLMIMILPLRLVWNLRVSKPEKLGIIATLTMASLCVLTALARVISVGTRSGVSTPSSSWLALWGMIEGAMAIVVACLPSFAIAIKRSYSSRHGYGQTNSGRSKGRHRHDIPLRTIGSGPPLTPRRSVWTANAGASSEEDILRKSGEIAVTKTLHVDACDAESLNGRSTQL